MNEKICINCDRTDKQIPLLLLTFNGEEKFICPQCMPIIIHKTQMLADKLPGMDLDSAPPAPHQH
jgi:hypothetical protein